MTDQPRWLTEPCKYPESWGEAEECPNPAVWMLIYQPFLIDEEQDIEKALPPSPQHTHTHGLSCAEHLQRWMDRIFEIGTDTGNEEYIFLAKFAGAYVKEHERVVPEKTMLLIARSGEDADTEALQDDLGEELDLTDEEVDDEYEPEEDKSPTRAIRGREITEEQLIAMGNKRPRDDNAPYGYKTDGVTPRQAPGRKPRKTSVTR